MTSQGRKLACYEDSVIRLHEQSMNVRTRTRVEFGIQGTVGIQTANELTRLTIQHGKIPSDYDLSIQLKCKRPNRGDGECIKICIQSPVRIQTANPGVILIT